MPETITTRELYDRYEAYSPENEGYPYDGVIDLISYIQKNKLIIIVDQGDLLKIN